MASLENTVRLRELVTIAGSTRIASSSIKKRIGVAPTHSAIHKAMKVSSKTTDYIVRCYIRDLEQALNISE